MASYSEYNPGPSVAEQHESLGALLDAFYAAAQPQFTGAIGASGSKSWSLVGAGATGGANPTINLTYQTAGGADTGTILCRYNEALNGTMDPSIPTGTSDYLLNWIGSQAYSAVEAWRSAVGGVNGVNTAIAGLWSGWWTYLRGSGDSTGTTTAPITYTDGSRSGTIAGFKLTIKYNPSAGELEAGVKQADGTVMAAVGGAADGTINVFGTGGALGQAVSQVPIPIASTSQAEQSWLGLQDAQVTNKKHVTNAGDLGEAGGLSDEPGAGEANNIFLEEGAIQVVVETPAAWLALTTLPSMLMGFLATVGYALSTLTSIGLLAALKSAADVAAGSLGAISTIATNVASVATSIGNAATVQLAGIQANTGTIATNVGTIATEAGRAADALEALETHGANLTTAANGIATAIETDLAGSVDGIPAKIEWLGTASAANDLVGSLQDVATAGGAQAVATNSVASQLNPDAAGSFAKRVVEALESIADSLKADGTTTPVTPKVSVGLRQLQDRLGDVADLQQSLTLRAHGLKVEATLGVTEEP